MNRRLFLGPVLASLAGLALTGCSSSVGASPSGEDTNTAAISVVASTNVWGDLAATIGGDSASVTSIIDDPSKDPHEYEANAQNQLALSKAQVVIENGGGYDDFIDTMLTSANNASAVVLNAVDISGKTGDNLNEHVWYDFPTVEKVVDEIETAFGKVNPDKAADYKKNAAELKGKIDGLKQKETSLKNTYAGQGASITEPVPLYVLDAIGLVNKTPAEFSEAIEEGTDVAPAVLQETLALYSDHAVKLLAYNEQTTGAQTEAVLKAAKDNSVPVVPVTETLPAGKNYVSWMDGNLDAIGSALAQ